MMFLKYSRYSDSVFCNILFTFAQKEVLHYLQPFAFRWFAARSIVHCYVILLKNKK